MCAAAHVNGCLFLSLEGSREVQNISVSMPRFPPRGGFCGLLHWRGGKNSWGQCFPAHPSLHLRAKWAGYTFEDWGNANVNTFITTFLKEARGTRILCSLEHNEVDFLCNQSVKISSFMYKWTEVTVRFRLPRWFIPECVWSGLGCGHLVCLSHNCSSSGD